MTPEEKQKRLRYLQLKKKKALAMAGNQEAAAEPEMSVGGLVKNVGADLRGQAEGIKALGGVALRTAAQRATGTPVMETEGAQSVGEMVKSLPSVPGAFVKRAGEIISNPGRAFYDKPITTALDVASVIPAASAVSRGASAAKRIAGSAIKNTMTKTGMGVKALEAFTGAPKAAINRRLVRPDQVRSAIPEGALETPYAPMADDVARSVNELGDKARVGAAKARETLSPSRYLNDGAFTRDELVAIVSNEKKRFRTQGKVIGEAKQAAMKKIMSLEKDISKLRGETVSQKNVEKIIKSLDQDINWAAKENAPTNLALERIRRRFDVKLKDKNQGYRESIAPVSKQMKTFKRAQDQFGLKKEVGGFVASDATASRLKSIGSGKMPMSERRLRELGRESGKDFAETAKDIDAALKFEGGATQGSRRVVSFRDILSGIGTGVGGVAGYIMGGPIGAGVGAAAGATGGRVAGSVLALITDTNGRKIAAKIIDQYLAIRPQATAKELITANPTLKAMVLSSMAKKSPQSAMAAYVGFRSAPKSITAENR